MKLTTEMSEYEKKDAAENKQALWLRLSKQQKNTHKTLSFVDFFDVQQTSR